jgi:deoxyribonucleoside regulator
MSIDKVDKTTLKEYERLQGIVECAILYKEGKTNKEIGEILKMGAPTVTRNLQRALEEGIIRIEIHPPDAIEVAREIKQKYNLKEVYVYPIGIADEVRNMLARLAAYYLEDLLDEKKEDIKRIGIGPGRTTLGFVMALSDKKRPDMEVLSTTSASHLETCKASNILIGIPAGKWECELSRFDPDMTLKQQEDYANILFFGIGKIPDMEGVSVLAILHESKNKADSKSKINERTLAVEINKLSASGAVGFINYQPIDSKGNLFDWNWNGYKGTFYEKLPSPRSSLRPAFLRLDAIKKMAKKPDKRVVCIAGGKDRLDAIKASLLGGYFNVLITDLETAKDILGQEDE